MEQRPSRKAISSTSSQEIPRILWNANVHYRVHNSPQFVPVLIQINPIHALYSNSWRSILILSSHLRLSLPCGLSPSGFTTKTLYVCLSPLPQIRATFPAHLILVDLINSIWRRVQITELLNTQLLHSPVPTHPRPETACFQTPFASVPPSTTETKCHIIWLLRETTDVRSAASNEWSRIGITK